MTFARFSKLLAVVLVAFALWRMRPPEEPARVAVLALPGASQEMVEVGSAREPAGEIRLSADTSGSSFWQHLLAVADGDGADAAPRPPLWSGERAAARVAAAPARLFAGREHADAPAQAFLGSSSGAIVEAADVTAGRLPFPYDRAVDAVASAVSALGRDHWSEWIAIPPPPGTEPAKGASSAPVAQFQLAHYTDTTYWFSPAYTGEDLEVSGDAFLRGLDRELRPIVATHVIGLARRRAAGRKDLFRTGGDQRPLIVFDDVAEEASRVFAPDSTPSSVVEQLGVALAEALAALRESVGKDGIVLVVGGPPTTRQTGVHAWYRIVRGSGGEGGSLPSVQLDAAASMVRYLAGVALDPKEKSLVPAELAHRFPVRATVVRSAAEKEADPPAQQWTASALESVPGAVSGN